MLYVPYGVSSAIITILVPYVLRAKGVSVDRIAEIVAIATLPTIWSFLSSPLVDLGPRRRTSILLAALGASISAGVALLVIHVSLTLLTVLLFLSTSLFGLYSSAVGAIMTTLPAELRGRTGGWLNAGNLGGGALGGGLLIAISDATTLPVLAVCVALLVFLPTMAALLIEEAARPRESFLPLVRNVVRDLGEVLKSRRTLFGLIFFLSPGGQRGRCQSHLRRRTGLPRVVA